MNLKFSATARYCLLAEFLCALFFCVPIVAHASPPTIDARPAWGDKLLSGHWQPLWVTLTNGPNGEPLHGEVQVTLEDNRTKARFSTYIAPIVLGRGAGQTMVPIYLLLSDNRPPTISVYVVSGRGGTGDVVARRTFDKLATTSSSEITVAAVSGVPDTLSFLHGQSFGLTHNNGALVAAQNTKRRNGRAVTSGGEPLNVVSVSNPALLPDRSAGYNPIGALYLGSDIPPDAFSDAQVAALRGYVGGGGFAVFCGDRWRGDERFRTWLPTTPAAGYGMRTVRAISRGKTALLGFDPMTAANLNRPNVPAFWRALFAEAVGIRSVGVELTGDNGYYYGYAPFASSVMRVGNMRAPAASMVGTFLLLYLVLLIPVNYLILKRLNRREWAWVTIPVFVVVFSCGAYAWGLATKGARLVVNTASIIEMGSGSGDALSHSMIGVFSPTLARYRVASDLPDALLWEPNTRGDAEPLVSEQKAFGQGGGAETRETAIPMWGMRVIGARAATQLGNGVVFALRRENRDVVGQTTNRTGFPLQNACLRIGKRSVYSLNSIAAGQTVSIDTRTTNPAPGGMNGVLQNDQKRKTSSPSSSKSVKDTLANSVTRILGDRPARDADIIFASWCDGYSLPVRVDDRSVTSDTQAALIVVQTHLNP